MIINFYMLHMSMKHKIFNNFHDALIVTKDHNRFKFKILISSYNLHSQVHSLATSVRARYLASIEERTTMGCFSEHVTALVPILNTHLSLNVDHPCLLPNLHQCPSSKLLNPFEYIIPKFVVPFTYLKICEGYI